MSLYSWFNAFKEMGAQKYHSNNFEIIILNLVYYFLVLCVVEKISLLIQKFETGRPFGMKINSTTIASTCSLLIVIWTSCEQNS